MDRKHKNAAAVALGRAGGKKGGPARAAKLTPEQRTESARKAVRARWAKRANMGIKRFDEFRKEIDETTPTVASGAADDTSDQVLLGLLKRLRTTDSPSEVRELSDQIERAIFHKQYR
jgi:hypothetical protein